MAFRYVHQCRRVPAFRHNTGCPLLTRYLQAVLRRLPRTLRLAVRLPPRRASTAMCRFTLKDRHQLSTQRRILISSSPPLPPALRAKARALHAHAKDLAQPFLSITSAGVRSGWLSHFSKSCILTTWATSGCLTLTVTVVSPLPISPTHSWPCRAARACATASYSDRDVERVVHVVQIVDGEGAGKGSHSSNLSYSPFVRLQWRFDLSFLII
jgi:hypothetical protein